MYEYKIIEVLRVYDGDTYRVRVDLGFYVHNTIKLRLGGIDTPETYRPKSEEERAHGLAVKAFVIAQFVNASSMRVKTEKDPDMSFDRWIGDIIITDDTGEERSLTDILRANDGEKRETYL